MGTQHLRKWFAGSLLVLFWSGHYGQSPALGAPYFATEIFSSIPRMDDHLPMKWVKIKGKIVRVGMSLLEVTDLLGKPPASIPFAEQRVFVAVYYEGRNGIYLHFTNKKDRLISIDVNAGY